jgi:hypothetical protein
MRRWEIIREVYNRCSGQQACDVFISEEACPDTDGYVAQKYGAGHPTIEKFEGQDGSVVYEIAVNGLRQRVTFTPISE